MEDKKLWLYDVPHGQILFECRIDGDPAAYGRPRMTKNGHAYTPKKTREFKEYMAWVMKAARKESGFLKTDTDQYGVRAVFYRSNYQRIDIDNLLKMLLDSVTYAGLWKDDAMVTEIAARVVKGHPEPHQRFVIYSCDVSAEEQVSNKVFQKVRHCKECGKLIEKNYPSSARSYCSLKCWFVSRSTTLKCSQCGIEFQIAKSKIKGNRKRRFCSRSCNLKYYAKERKKNGSDKWLCRICGGKVSRKEYTRCWACMIKERKALSSNYWHGIRFKKPHPQEI